MLWEEVFEEQSFNPVVFNVFTELMGKNRAEEMTSLWEKRLDEGPEDIKIHSVEEELKEMLVLEESGEYIPEMYKTTLALLSRSLKEVNKFAFNREGVYSSGLYMGLNILSREEEKDASAIIGYIEFVIKEWKGRSVFSDGAFLGYFFETIEEKIGLMENQQDRQILMKKKEEVLKEIETQILDKDHLLDGKDFKVFFDFFESPSFEEDYYVDKIIVNEDTCGNIAQILFKYFPRGGERLCRRLKNENFRMSILVKIIESVKKSDSPQVFLLLKEKYFIQIII